ncbi:MAG: hypothetical protein H6873_01990 [Hyphomicrobiaceae bacterium]|nr:hypothetical protein [Hyphomicrobiaceae bacterium]
MTQQFPPAMPNFEPVFTHSDINLVRVIITALKAHGFHPREDGPINAASFPGFSETDGYAIEVPSSEAEDARLLAGHLHEEMFR